ncbi:MAG: prolyl-tRNA synthetase, family [Clostridia bacterium]|jgi:prolyl-tRNA synthetase|nr:prolyl-tRNA synthetase, family [Clostridia bacterium]
MAIFYCELKKKGFDSMLVSKLLGERYKEKPGEAITPSHIYLLRGGYIRQMSNGIYSMLLPAKKVTRKIEQIIREEMDAIDGQEVLFPVVLPAELWQESGRWDSVANRLIRFKDRIGHDMLLGMTHEEAAVHLARSEVKSYSKYPFMIYQIQTKFRDESRSRGGLIRVREFTMKDAYSFHTSQEDLEQYYERAFQAYHRIFRRVGIPEVVSVASDNGMMGGKVSHEYMLLTDSGEDTIVLCKDCGYKSNMEVAVSKIAHNICEEQAIEEVYTPDIKDIDSLANFFKVSPSRLMKAAVFAVENSKRPLVVFLRGDLQVNEAKLRNAVRANVFPLTDYENVNLCFGFIGAYGLDAEGVDIVYDISLQGEKNLIGGANKLGYHLEGISIDRDIKPDNYADVAKVNEEDTCTKCGGKLTLSRGIEVGNIFQLDTKYTAGMNMTFTDIDGKQKHPVMGCYGIGVGRLLASIIEARHDEYGPIWPMSVAPWQIHICLLNSENEYNRQVGFNLYEKLGKTYDVLMDDRNVAAGTQFADADLLGIPLRIVVSKRNLEKGELELVTRDRKIKKNVKLEDIEKELREMMNEM